MATQVQNRRGSTAEHSTFTGAAGELTVDTTKKTVVVHDGSTAGGAPLLKEDLSNLPAGTIDNADVNASAAIAGTKISPDFGSQNVTTTGTSTAASFIPTSSTAPTNGVYLPAANSVALATNGTGRLFVDASGNVGAGSNVFFDKPTNVNRLSYVSGGFSDTNIPGLGLALYRGATGEHGHLFWSGQSTGGNGRVLGSIRMEQTVATVANGGGDLIFNTNPGTAALPTERLRITSTGQLSHIGAGSAGSPAVAFNGSAPSNSLVIDSTGRVGLGTASPGQQLTVATSTGNCYIEAKRASQSAGQVALQLTGGTSGTDWILYQPASSNDLRIFGNSNDRLTVTSAGLVGVGTTSPNAATDIRVASAGASILRLTDTANNQDLLCTMDANKTIFLTGGSSTSAFAFVSGTAGERARIDSSGRLLVGTSTARSNFFNSNVTAALQVEEVGINKGFASLVVNRNDVGGSALIFGKTRGTAIGSNTIVNSGDDIGAIFFSGADGNEFVNGASIFGQVDGTPGANDMPGRLVFSTTADGASSPTERMRIDSLGSVLLGTTANRGNFLQVAGAIGQNVSAFASAQTAGDFVITVSGLPTLNGSRHLRAALFVFYSGINANMTGDTLLLSVIKIGGSSTYDYLTTTDIIGATSVSAVGSSQTNNGVQLSFDVNDSNNGGVYAMLVGHGPCTLSIAG